MRTRRGCNGEEATRGPSRPALRPLPSGWLCGGLGDGLAATGPGVDGADAGGAAVRVLDKGAGESGATRVSPHRHRKDANHNHICLALTASGWYVQDTSSTNLGYDAILVKAGRIVLVEIKDGSKPPSAQKLTPHEEQVHAALARCGVTVELLTCLEDLAVLDRPHRGGSYDSRQRGWR